jgi:hypothetical protein
MSFTSLHTFKKFFQTYPSIVQLLPEQLLINGNQYFEIVQSLTEQFKLVDNEIVQLMRGSSHKIS